MKRPLVLVSTQFGLCVRARLPFRVLKLGQRVIIDGARRW